MFEISITNTNNAAFCSEETGEVDSYMAITEISRILERIQDDLKELSEGGVNHYKGSCADINGNKVGVWKLSL